jgi:hypothetical protein
MSVMPAKAGIHASKKQRSRKRLPWGPAFAGPAAYGLARHREQAIARTFAPITYARKRGSMLTDANVAAETSG